MEFIILLLSGIIGLLHLVIMGLEMFAPAEKQAKTFAMPMKFQGDIRLKVLLLLNLFVVIVGIYGGKTVTKSIYLIQALPAIITVLFILLQLI